MTCLATALLWMSATTNVALADQVKGNPCATCHKDVAKNLVMTRHGVTADARTPANNCMMCHGEALRHMSNPMKNKPQYTFKKDKKGFSKGEQADKACIACHKGSEQTHWAGSTHQQNDVACVSCHSVHKADIALNNQTSTALCLSCHNNEKQNLFKMHNHPLLSGQMNCVSCHNPHGNVVSGETLMKKRTVNETCYQCHADKHGPFLNKHQPVTEDCTNCHAPHGSNKEGMLKMRTTQLCMSCHADAHDFANEQGVLTGNCLSCHSAIHGSNAPTSAGKHLQSK